MEQKNVLVIANDTFQCDVLTAIFTYENYNVEAATTSWDALYKLKQGGWDVVVLNMQYRDGINGIALLEEYKKDPVYTNAKKLPILLAIVNDEDQAEKIRMLVDWYFIPGNFTPGDVLTKAQECLKKRQEPQLSSAPE